MGSPRALSILPLGAAQGEPGLLEPNPLWSGARSLVAGNLVRHCRLRSAEVVEDSAKAVRGRSEGRRTPGYYRPSWEREWVLGVEGGWGHPPPAVGRGSVSESCGQREEGDRVLAGGLPQPSLGQPAWWGGGAFSSIWDTWAPILILWPACPG